MQLAFLFDCSCGHDRQRPDGLSINKMNKVYGGEQPKMRELKILSKELLGKHIHDEALKVGDTQQMVFSKGDDGPFYLSNV